MLTGLRIKNFKGLEDVEIELGQAVVFVGPNNSGKTTALQALALWELGLRVWYERRAGPLGVALNRRDLVAMPVASSDLLWRNRRHLRSNLLDPEDSGAIDIQIWLSGIDGVAWECGFAFRYANEESLFAQVILPSNPFAVHPIRVSFLPAMSGIAAIEDRLTDGAINVRIGEGRTAEVLRNLCLQVYEAQDSSNWTELVSQIKNLFGVALKPPEYITERGQITMSYEERGVELDLASSGRGLQQTLLLLTYLYTRPGTVLLLDEPDAHLEILRQRQIYQLLTKTAAAQGCQVIAASHSEILLNDAAERDVVIAFVGKPHRIDGRNSHVHKALQSIGFDQYLQAEQTGWVLYLEGSTDLAVLQAFAETLGHPAEAVLQKPFVRYVGNVRSKAKEHFFGLREAKRDLAGVAIFDSDAPAIDQQSLLVELKWKQREIENYLCFPETLMAYANQSTAMKEAIDEISGALRTLGKPDPFGPEIKASDEFLGPVFQKYFEKLGISNLMSKTDYHNLARLVPVELIDPEVSEKLDRIVEVAASAKPE